MIAAVLVLQIVLGAEFSHRTLWIDDTERLSNTIAYAHIRVYSTFRVAKLTNVAEKVEGRLDALLLDAIDLRH
jgi:hypothetical protein